MRRTWIAAIALAGWMSSTAAAQEPGPQGARLRPGVEVAKAVIANASKAMGADNLTSITFYGSGANFNLGQNNNANMPWPRTNINDYSRSIDFANSLSRATWQTYAVAVTGGAAALAPGQQNITAQNTAWAQQLEIWTTPWGFLKGAAANNATVKSQTVGGRKYNVVTWNTTQKAPSGLAYKVVGYINANNMVEKVDTWIENPVFGDMLVENEYTHYRDANGVKFPSDMVQKRAGWPTFEAQILGINANPANIQQLVTAPVPAGRGGGPGGPGGPGGAPAGPTSEKLADGVYRINGAYNALAVEFADHILLFEPGPQNEARAQAIIAETKKVIPNKPIRYGVISHHHFDHTSGLPAVVAEGITIVTHETNRAFFMNALSAPRTLAPDSMSKSGKKPKVEGITGDKRVFQDATRTVEIHLIKGLPHADGLLVAYLPKEKILAYADMFNLPTAAQPVPNPPVVGTMVFLDNIERLKLDPERVMSVHSLNPDRLTSVADIRASLGRK
ncbi:MAG TPA: MBL fold metallo-hydrolase [Vicinamibacterales bacterium]|jgi:glyoxylase-like metal-dependent hydrolase (beta-lactamase superfamily II)